MMPVRARLRLCSRSRLGLVSLIGALTLESAFAAHPLVTEDTATQGAGNIEIENGLSSVRHGATNTLQYQPQLSYGATALLDLIAQPAWLDQHVSSGPTAHGWGDTNLDAKWRFFGSAPWSVALRAGITVSTNQRGLGLPAGETSEHAILVLTYQEEPLAVHFNGGYMINPPDAGLRRHLGHFSTAAMWSVGHQTILTGEIGVDSDPDPARSWRGSLLAGIIYSARPGLDLDLGFQYAGHSKPEVRTWLAGLTYRFSL